MINIFIAFVTGLTTGGLSCLAVQGGLLASSLAHQIEQENMPNGTGTMNKSNRNQPHLAAPILLFLGAKLVTYTILGFFLGLLGSVIQLTPLARAIMQLFIGIFVVGNGLRVLNVHPIFRYFAFEPPAFIRRYIRKTAKSGTSVVTPLLLGALTVFIPCGITQSMMAVAISTGDALAGAAIMFAFTLGASPVFFLISYFATKLGSKVEKYFMRAVGVIVLIMGLITIDTGLNLVGSPVSVSALVGSLTDQSVVEQIQKVEPVGNTPEPKSQQDVIVVNVKNNGYEPGVTHAKANTPLVLELVTENVHSCSLAFVIPSLNYQKILKSTGIEKISIPPQTKDTILRYSCSMGMYTGVIVFDA